AAIAQMSRGAGRNVCPAWRIGWQAMLVIGLVGAIGAGKSEVMRLLEDLGARTVAADELSREVLAPGQPALVEVRAAFGDEYFDATGALRRRRLGELVFQDEAARQRLDAIVHPHMTAALERRLAEWRAEGVPVAVVESAVLEEMGARPLVDRVVRVTAPFAVRLARLMARDGSSEAEAQRRLEAHRRLGLEAPPAEYEIENAGDRAQLRTRVEHLWAELV
ncbi:MAG: dephospho-CoA kinase, partial [Armatimonadetes bacterium]|nr:dephospho-CoA kinase [Armatimonadota bacterium]